MNIEDLSGNRAINVLLRCGSWLIFCFVLIPSLCTVAIIWYNKSEGGSVKSMVAEYRRPDNVLPSREEGDRRSFYSTINLAAAVENSRIVGSEGFWVLHPKVSVLVASFFWGVIGGSIGVLRLSIWNLITNTEIILMPVIGGLIGVLTFGFCVLLVSVLTVAISVPAAETVSFISLIAGTFPRYVLDRLEWRFGSRN